MKRTSAQDHDLVLCCYVSVILLLTTTRNYTSPLLLAKNTIGVVVATTAASIFDSSLTESKDHSTIILIEKTKWCQSPYSNVPHRKKKPRISGQSTMESASNRRNFERSIKPFIVRFSFYHLHRKIMEKWAQNSNKHHQKVPFFVFRCNRVRADPRFFS